MLTQKENSPQQRADIAVLIPNILQYGCSVDEFERELQSLVKQVRVVIVNLNKIKFIDSSGIGTLVRAHTSLVNQGKKLALVVPSETSLREKFRLTKLDTVLTIYETVDEARANLRNSLTTDSEITAQLAEDK